LCDAFGEDHVFYDVDSINPGDDFRKVIIDTLVLVDQGDRHDRVGAADRTSRTG
jgi:hypothetical protein